VELITAAGERVVIDAGYGVVGLGESLVADGEGRPLTVHVILTHLHWDHIQGFPFFAPIYVPGNRIVIHSASERTAREAMVRLFTSIYSPIMGVGNLAAKIEYAELELGIELGGAQITPFALRHSVPTTGLRVDDGRRVLVHATDHEGGDAMADARLCETGAGADLMIHDAQFTAAEHAQYPGWGHSPTEAAVKNAVDARAKKLALFHYDPIHTDDDVDAQLRHATELARGRDLEVVAAAEGLAVEI
jgi:ribonuclease BN (tRNA processing enzyme)